MSTIISQEYITTGSGNLVVSLVKLTATSDSVTLPRMVGTSNRVVQLRRPGDVEVTVTQSTATSVTLAGSVGNEVLLVSFSDSPIPSPVGDGA